MRAVVLACLALVLAGCAGGGGGGAAPAGGSTTSPATGVPTLTASPLPEQPATGLLLADLRQSSRDAALARMQVWVDNDTTRDLTPTRITYTDPRFREPVVGERLREIPSRSTRGFVLALPPRPDCARATGLPVAPEDPLGSVEITYAGRGGAGRDVEVVEVLEVADVAGVAGRYARARCLEIGVGRVAALSFADRVVPGDPARTEIEVGAEGALTLVVEPTGVPDGRLTIATVAGTPVLSPVGGGAVWRPAVSVDGDDRARRIRLPLKPTRCDPHVFQEAGGATAFEVGLRLDGVAGRITVRMSPAGAGNAIDFALASCGLTER